MLYDKVGSRPLPGTYLFQQFTVFSEDLLTYISVLVPYRGLIYFNRS